MSGLAYSYSGYHPVKRISFPHFFFMKDNNKESTTAVYLHSASSGTFIYDIFFFYFHCYFYCYFSILLIQNFKSLLIDVIVELDSYSHQNLFLSLPREVVIYIMGLVHATDDELPASMEEIYSYATKYRNIEEFEDFSIFCRYFSINESLVNVNNKFSKNIQHL